jgi:hypothetical protein
MEGIQAYPKFQTFTITGIKSCMIWDPGHSRNDAAVVAASVIITIKSKLTKIKL